MVGVFVLKSRVPGHVEQNKIYNGAPARYVPAFRPKGGLLFNATYVAILHFARRREI